MAAYYYDSPEVRRIAEKLIAKHHPHLAGVRMEFLFRSEASRRSGKLRLAQARKMTGIPALLATPELAHDPDASSEGCDFFVVEAAADTWLMLDERGKIGVIDHELAHCGVDIDDDGNASLHILPHDLEDFAGVLRRNGLYRPDVTSFVHGIGSDLLSLWAEQVPDDEPTSLLRDGAGLYLAEPTPDVSEDGEILSAASEIADPPFT